ncbi:hypothetical protein WN944_013135 [Citrus x changshan-huyou]|uniref:Uncharacterized protein n=1 Tax=Citrus x changshan-huyou TaxID=2935761 RepID=A0AAP0M593_9ROSI
MGYLLSFRFHPAGEEIINLLNEKGLDPDFSVQTIYKSSWSFCEHGHASKVEWFMLEFHSEKLQALFPPVMLVNQVQTQQLPIHHMTYNFRNHVAENSFSRVETQQLPNHNLPFDCENHVAENTVQGVAHEQVAGHNMTFNYRNHDVKNIFATEELRQLPGHHLASDSGNHAAENIFPGSKDRPPILMASAMTDVRHFQCKCDQQTDVDSQWPVHDEHPLYSNLD